MILKERNYAFIDAQNLYLGVLSLGWKLDYRRFRVYLKEKYQVVKAYMFIGYLPTNQRLYDYLTDVGYDLAFKPTLPDKSNIKGNIDADLVLRAMINYPDYDQAVIITSDGDFYSLVDYLYQKRKLKIVISSLFFDCSWLLKEKAKERIIFLANLRKKLEINDKTKNTAKGQNL